MNDKELIYESYKSLNLKQVMLESAADTFIRNSQNINTIEEANAILEIHRELVSEGILGGLKSMGQRAVAGASKAGANIAGAAGQAARTAGAVGSAVAGQIGDNAKNIYQSGSDDQSAQQVIIKANAAAQELANLINSAIEKYPDVFSGGSLGSGGDVMSQRLGDIINRLVDVQSQTKANMETSQNKGYFGGVGDAAKAAYNAPPASGGMPTSGRQPTTT